MLSPETLLPQLQQFGVFGYVLIFIASAGESLPLIGLFVPGTVIITIFGFFSAQGYLNLYILIVLSSIGAVLGDWISYKLGKRGTHLFKAENKILKLSHLEKGQAFIKKYGNKGIFLGRFLGPLRPILPFVAGLSEMPLRSFMIWNIASGVSWSGIYLVLGYFFGGVFHTIETWSTRIGAAAIGLFLLIVLIRFLAKRSGKAFAFVGAVVKSFWQSFVGRPGVQQWIKRHPKLVSFLRYRGNRKKFTGLPLTIISLGFIYVLSALFGVIASVLRLRQLVDIDMRVNQLFYVFRDPLLTKFFLWITALGKWEVVLCFILIAGGLWWIWNKRTLVVGLVVSLSGTFVISYMMKVLFDRPRPLNPVYIETSASFPSTHATLAIGVYGFIAYGLMRSIKSWKIKMNMLFVAMLLGVLIGLSRLYLGVHFVSDVWSGYLLGTLCLLFGISVTEWLNEKYERHFVGVVFSKRVLYPLTVVIVVLGTAFVALFATYYAPHQVTQQVITETQVIDQPLNLFNQIGISKFTENIIGVPQQPIQFVFVAASQADVEQTFTQHGWYVADEVTFSSLFTLTTANILNRPYPQAPTSPSFWNTQVQIVGFEQPTESNTARERHHLRVWSTGFKTTEGKLIFVGAASLDRGTKWLVTHDIDPNIDGEREYILNSLEAAGVMLSNEKRPLVDPMLGQHVVDDPFFTDGQAYVIFLK